MYGKTFLWSSINNQKSAKWSPNSILDHLWHLAMMSSRLSWKIANVSQNCLQDVFKLFQCGLHVDPIFFKHQGGLNVVPELFQSFFKIVPFFSKLSQFFFHQNCQNCSYVMTDKSRGLSRTVLSDQLGRQRRLTLKSQPPIHKMQPISLLHFLQNLQFF